MTLESDAPPEGTGDGVGDHATALLSFRQRLFACFKRRPDALFELTDAVLTTGTIPSPVHLSLAAMHRRGWGSLYAALRHGHIDGEALRELLAEQRLTYDPNRARVYAVDRSSWPRCDAETSPGRGYYYHPSRHSAGQPIVAGWSYQIIAEVGFARDSWVSPADARRVSPKEDANLVATEQMRALLGRLPQPSFDPLFVCDAGYDPVKLQRELEGCAAQIVVRLHSDRVFYADPKPLEKRPAGRPQRHGARFDLKDPETWPQPDAEHRDQTGDYGAVRVRAWSDLHPKTRRATERYGSETASVVRGTVVLVEVERLPSGERRRRPKALWLWWYGIARGPRSHLEELLPQVLHRTRDPTLETGPGLDYPEGAPSRAGRPLGESAGPIQGRSTQRVPAEIPHELVLREAQDDDGESQRYRPEDPRRSGRPDQVMAPTGLSNSLW